jgi:hypothetical protein
MCRHLANRAAAEDNLRQQESGLWEWTLAPIKGNTVINCKKTRTAHECRTPNPYAAA